MNRQRADWRWRCATVVSLLMHAGLTQVAASTGRQSEPVNAEAPKPDQWVGATFDIDAVLEEGPDRAGAEPQVGLHGPTPESEEQPAPEQATAPAPSPKAPAPRAADTPEETDAPQEDSRVEQQRVAPPPSVRPAELDGGLDAKPAQPASSDGQSKVEPASPATGTKARGEYGAAGQQSHVRDLAKAFTRARPRASNTDPMWDKLPIGYTATALVRLQTSAEGRVLSASLQPIGDAGAVPSELERIVRRTTGLLGAGQFALPDGVVGAGAQTLRLHVELLQGKPSDDPSAEPEDSVEVGYTPPSRERPGRAFFRKHSGRMLVMRVSVVGAHPRPRLSPAGPGALLP